MISGDTQILYQLTAATSEIFVMLPTSRLEETLRHAFRDGLHAAPHNGARILTAQENPAVDELVLAAVNAGAFTGTVFPPAISIVTCFSTG